MPIHRTAALAAASLAAAALLITGCAPSPEAQESASANEPECIVDETTLGVGTPGELVTDERGAYCHLKIDLSRVDLLPLEDVRTGTWGADTGIIWSDEAPALDAETIEMSQQLSAQWVVGEFLDGKAIEMPGEAYSTWIQTSDIISDEWRADYLTAWNDKGETSGLTVTPFTTPLARDNAARVSQVALTPSSTSVLDVEGLTYVESCYDVTAVYAGADEARYDLSGTACSTFPYDGSTVIYALEGTHGSFTVTDESGAIVAEEKSDS